MTQPIRVQRKASAFLKFWKKPLPPITDFPIQVHESEIMLPTEIWLDILACLPQDGLEPMSRICRRLRWIVLPLYFRSQQMFPFLETFAFRRLSMAVELAGYQERSLQRLNFLCSDQISPAIRELFISPYPPGYNRRHRVTHNPVETVMQPLILALPRFENLTNLVLQFPLCNEALFSALEALHLDSFELEVLPTSLGDIPIPARLEFFFNCSNSPLQTFPPDELTLRFLFPRSIEHIVAGITGTDTLTRTLHRYPSALTSLKTLDVSQRFVAAPHFIDALAACPNLSSLRLRSAAIDGSTIPAFPCPLPATAIPHLTCYHGPAVFAPVFARGRTLRTVRLWSSHSVAAVSAPWVLYPILQQLGPSVTALELGVTLVPPALLETLCTTFPALTALAINAHLDVFHPGTVERRVLAPPAPLSTRLALPAGLRLQSLKLGAQLAGTPAAPAEIFESASELLGAFPGGYDPTSWRRWVVDRPWYCVEWTCIGESGTGMDGTLSVEYGEHYFRGFERGRGFRRGPWMKRCCAWLEDLWGCALCLNGFGSIRVREIMASWHCWIPKSELIPSWYCRS
ncbi:hypothetical protein B0H13DRAFT_2662654 [Mycena leptocephala]|nr:hypothetical protein B0H13DRAFT_2662654 [Mycena leptocephala]